MNRANDALQDLSRHLHEQKRRCKSVASKDEKPKQKLRTVKVINDAKEGLIAKWADPNYFVKGIEPFQVRASNGSILTVQPYDRVSDFVYVRVIKPVKPSSQKCGSGKILTIRTVADVAAILGTDDKEDVRLVIINLAPATISAEYEKYRRRIASLAYICDEKTKAETWELSVIDTDNRILAKGEVTLPEASFTTISDTSGLSTLTRITKDLETLYESNPEDRKRIEYLGIEASPLLTEACEILSASSEDIHNERIQEQIREWVADCCKRCFGERHFPFCQDAVIRIYDRQFPRFCFCFFIADICK